MAEAAVAWYLASSSVWLSFLNSMVKQEATAHLETTGVKLETSSRYS